MNVIACADPRCKAESHIVGTAGHSMCRGEVGALIEDVLGADPAPPAPLCGVWSPGQPHPAGGYDQVETAIEPYLDGLEVICTRWTRDGDLHREDGPAMVDHGEDGGAISWSWMHRGSVNRGDGPAVWEWHDDAAEGHLVHRRRSLGSTTDDDVCRRLRSALEDGADRRHVVGWLAYDDATTAALAPYVPDPGALFEPWAAGVREYGALLAVLRGELPISWAAAGADPALA